jgi:hypothetical protein
MLPEFSPRTKFSRSTSYLVPPGWVFSCHIERDGRYCETHLAECSLGLLRLCALRTTQHSDEDHRRKSSGDSYVREIIVLPFHAPFELAGISPVTPRLVSSFSAKSIWPSCSGWNSPPSMRSQRGIAPPTRPAVLADAGRLIVHNPANFPEHSKREPPSAPPCAPVQIRRELRLELRLRHHGRPLLRSTRKTR